MSPRMKTWPVLVTVVLVLGGGLIINWMATVSARAGCGGGDSAGPFGSADVVSITINQGALITTTRDVVIDVSFAKSADQYLICEDPGFKGCDWQNVPGYGPIKYRLSEGNGLKKLYFRAKRGVTPGAVVTLTIELKEAKT